MKKYSNIFFDLDRTLWDFEANENETLNEIYSLFLLSKIGPKKRIFFIQEFKSINIALAEKFKEGKISHQEFGNRFHETLLVLKINDYDLSKEINYTYSKEFLTKKNLFPYTIEVLSYLKANYKLHLLTNGYRRNQLIKLNHSKLDMYFDNIICQDDVNCEKPNPKYFELALIKTSAEPNNSIMVGDSIEVDLNGAKKAGIDQIYFNPEGTKHNEKFSFEIKSLHELLEIFP